MEKVSFVIDDAVATVIRAPLVTPFRIATGQHDELANVFLRLRTSDGICGYGEAAVATHITGETVAATLANLQAVAAALRGRSIDTPEEVCREFYPIFRAAGGRRGRSVTEHGQRHFPGGRGRGTDSGTVHSSRDHTAGADQARLR